MSTPSTNQFVITDAGLYAASLATPTGPYIQIVGFKLGNNATTPASSADTALAGQTVYSGVPASFSYYDAHTIQINLEVPADVGPFDYGEMGLYLPGDILFARFSYGILRTKQTAISSGFANVLRIKALLRLSQGPAIFNVEAGTIQTTLEIDRLSLVNTPEDHPESPLVIVHEPNDFQESVYLYKHEYTLWNIVNYVKIGSAMITSSSDPTHLNASFFGVLYQPPTGSLGKYLIQTQGGYLRMVKTINGLICELAEPIDTAPLVGQLVAVYELETVLLNELSTGLGNLQLGYSAMQADIAALQAQVAHLTQVLIGDPPVTDFTFTPNTGNIPLSVTFTDVSVG